MKYAKLAQNGYAAMTEDAYTDRATGFNTPNSSWMFGTRYKADSPNVLLNDGDSSWGSQMVIEITDKSGCGYAANYGSPNLIDRHLYETIPADIRTVFITMGEGKPDEIERILSFPSRLSFNDYQPFSCVLFVVFMN